MFILQLDRPVLFHFRNRVLATSSTRGGMIDDPDDVLQGIVVDIRMFWPLPNIHAFHKAGDCDTSFVYFLNFTRETLAFIVYNNK